MFSVVDATTHEGVPETSEPSTDVSAAEATSQEGIYESELAPAETTEPSIDISAIEAIHELVPKPELEPVEAPEPSTDVSANESTLHEEAHEAGPAPVETPEPSTDVSAVDAASAEITPKFQEFETAIEHTAPPVEPKLEESRNGEAHISHEETS